MNNKFEDLYTRWKILIVDDDKEIHSLVRSTLEDFVFKGRKLQILNA